MASKTLEKLRSLAREQGNGGEETKSGSGTAQKLRELAKQTGGGTEAASGGAAAKLRSLASEKAQTATAAFSGDMPQVDRQRYEQLSQNLKASGERVQAAEATLQEAQSALQSSEQALQGMLASWQADPTEANRTAYEQAYSAYQETLRGYEQVYSSYSQLHSDYELDAVRYDRFLSRNKAAYDSWRGTVRDADTVRSELEDLAVQIKVQEALDMWNGTNETAALLQKQALLQQELDWSEYLYWADLMGNEDFTDKSGYVSTANGKEPVLNAVSRLYSETGFDDLKYDYINRNPDALSRGMVNDVSGGLSALGIDSEYLKQMTGDEIALFNYIYATQSPETAYQYIAYLSGDLNIRQKQEQQAKWAQYAKEDPVGSSVFSALMAPVKGLSYVGQAADLLGDGRIDQNAGYNKFSYIPSAIREEVSSNWGPVGSFAYNTGMSMADFLSTTVAGMGNSTLTMTLMGSGAAADTVLEAKDRGLGDGQAFALGTIAGIAEGVTEKFSIEALLDADILKDSLIKYIGKNAFTEASEETASGIVNFMADVMISQDKSQWQQAINAYKTRGNSDSKAFALAFRDQAMNIGLDALGGLISGGLMGGGGATVQFARATAAGSGMDGTQWAELVLEAAVSDPESSAYQVYQRLNRKLETGQTLSAYDKGLLQQAVNETRDAENSQAPANLDGVTAEADPDPDGAGTAQEEFWADTGKRIKENMGLTEPEGERKLTLRERVREIVRKLRGDPEARPDGTEAIRQEIKEAAAMLSRGEISQEEFDAVTDALGEQMIDETGMVREAAYPEAQSLRFHRKAESDALAKAGKAVQTAGRDSVVWEERPVTAQEAFQREVNDQIARNMNIEKPAQVKAAASVDGDAEYDGGMSYGEGDNVSDGDPGRDAGAGTGKQAGSVSGRTDRTRTAAVAHAKARVQRQNAAGDLLDKGLIREQSSRELGIERGTDRRSAVVIPEEYYDEALESLARRVEDKTGCRVVFTVGGIEIRGADGSPVTVRGVFSGELIVLQADHKIDPERLADHEIFHHAGSKMPGLVEHIRQQLDPEAFDRVMDRYLEELWPVYGCKETAYNEYEEAYERIREEVLADAYAGINAFGAGVVRFTDDVRRIAGDMGMGTGRQENGVRQTDGPPERYSYGGENVDPDYLSKADATMSELETGERLVDFVKSVVSMADMSARSLRKFRLGRISENHAALIESIMQEKYPQFSADGYELWIDGTGIGHIENRHGEYGRADHSMETEDAKRLIPWAAQNAERGRFVLDGKGALKLSERFYNRDGSRAPEISLEKAIDSDTIYVSECVPDSKKKRIWITSAYIKKGSTGQELNMEDNSSPQPTPKAILDSNATTDIVADGSGAVKEKFSVDDSAEGAKSVREKPGFDRSTAPWKVRSGLKRVESGLLRNIQGALGAHRLVDRPYLREAVQEMADEYMSTGTVSDKTLDRLFADCYERGIVIDRELHDQYQDVKKHLNTQAVTLSEQDKADIADFNDFRRRAMGNLRIVNEGGLPVDVAYQELNDMAPGLFPESITHPADQLVKMFEVAKSLQISQRHLGEYYGEGAGDFRKYARHEFEAAVWDNIGGLAQMRRYLDYKQAQKEAGEKAPATAEEAAGMWQRLKEARKTYEKAMARSFLTEADEILVGRLLRGEMQPEQLDPEAKGTKGILAVYEGKREYCRLMDLLGEYRRGVKGQLRRDADGYLETAGEWKDKGAGLLYSRETMERNIQDIIKDPELAKKVNAHFFEPIRDAEAAAVRMKNEFRDRVRRMELSRRIDKKKGNLVSEAHAVQLCGEAMDNIRILEATRGRMKIRDGKTLEEWRAVVDDLWLENPGLDRARIENAVQEFRKIYDELFQKMNEVRIRWGYEPVNYRSGYFPHFQPGDGDGILQRFGKALGIDTSVVALPTTINGLTHTFKPGIQWFGNAQERLGFNTAYDAVEGFDKYIEGVASVIHQTENIQKLRALASQVRYRTTDEGIRKQVDDIYADDRLTEDEKQAKITQLYEKGKFSLANFVVELEEYTNLLANKKSKLDRTVEALIGRRFYTSMKWLESRVGANMIAGNLTSAFTNFIPLTQAGAQVGYGNLLKGMWQTLAAYRSGDGMVGMSSFLQNRIGSDPLVQTWGQKVSGVLGTPMELIDGFVSGSIVRAAYEQNLKRGMPEAEAAHEADIFAAKVMAERSKGGMPTLFSATNPLFKLFTQFQLEVNNQFSEVFKDLPRAYRDKGVKALALALLRYFLGAWLFNELYEKLIGRRPALDPIDIVLDLGGDLFGENAVGIGEAGTNFATAILEELPFSSGLSLLGVELDGGRIPVSSAIPDLSALWDAATNTELAPEKRWQMAQNELNTLAYVLPPFGGNQVSKIWKGAKAYIEGGSYSVTNDGSDILQYPVHNDESGDFWKLIQSMILGKSSLEEAQEWVEDGFDSLNAKQTAVYQDMLDAGVSSRDAYGLIDDLRAAEDKLGVLQDANVSGDAKAIAFYGLLASEKERELMDTLADIGADAGAVTATLVHLHDADGLTGVERYGIQADVLNGSALTEQEKHLIIGSWLGKDEVSEDGNLTQYGKFQMAMKSGISTYEYLQHRRKGGSVDDLLEYTGKGMSAENASELSLALDALEPAEGEERVTNLQRWRVCVDFPGDEEHHLVSLSGVMTDSQFEKVERAWEFGVKPELYVWYHELRERYDANGNGSYSQAEVTATIDAMGDELTNEQKAALWQIVTGSKKAANNPYSMEVGQKVLDAQG